MALETDWPSRRVRVLLLSIALAAVGVTRSLPMWMAAEAERAPFAYEAPDGETYPYLIGQDSYSWVRKARNYLTTGSPCDVRTADGCRDLLRHAPVGSTMPYAASLHVEAIAWLHLVLGLFDAGRPLEASAFWVQVVVGMLGVIPAWFAGCRLGGAWAGFIAALLIGVHPAFLERSLGADNDVWNVVLPLCATAALLPALDDEGPARRIAWAAAAAGFVALHAAIWSGWLLGFVALAAGISACVGWSVMRDRLAAARGASDTRALVLVAVCFLGLTIPLASLRTDAWDQLRGNLGQAQRRAAGAPAAPAPETDVRDAEFPNTMRNVGELRVPTFDEIAERLGGAPLLLAGFVGVLLLAVPRDGRGRFDLWVVAGAAGALAVGLRAKAPPGLLAAGVALPMLLLLGAWARRPEVPQSVVARGGIVVAVWIAATLFQTLGAQRFMFLAVAPLGLAFAGGAGSVVELVRRRTRGRAAAWVTVAALLLPVGLVVRAGVEYARAALPNLNDAWWDSLRELRAATPPDAIVDAWWSYGYWIEYGAERGVSADGSSLQTRIPHWLARALMAPDVEQAIGLLRMLSCGSDAAPEAEGALGAYERLRAAGADGMLAHDLVLALAPLDRAGAERLLDARGYPASRRAEILAATHCSPPPVYLMLSDHPLRQGDIRYQGNWDPRRAAFAHRLRRRPEAEAIAAGVDQLGLSPQEARAMYETVRGLRSDAAVEGFIAPMTPYFTGWIPCRAQGRSGLVCDVQPQGGSGSTLERFTYVAAEGSIEHGTLALRQRGHTTEQSPEALLVADGPDVHEVPPVGVTAAGYAVLLDRSGSRALFGPPYLIRSVLTRLAKLDGRGAHAFEKVGERNANGERVTTWRIRWPIRATVRVGGDEGR